MSQWYKDFKQFRESDYNFTKRWFQDEYFSIFREIKCRKYSRFEQLKDRAYDDYMISGLCYGNYHGLEKIKHFRLKYIRKIKRTKRRQL